jgi:predicted  nucleic acid-binding Zn-ribbon protein
VRPEISELREKYDALQAKYENLSEHLSRAEGRITDNSRQTIWQFVIFLVSVAGLVIGLVNYQTSVLEKRFEEINHRFEEVNRRIEQGQRDLSARLERVERNLDELNKELRARRQ